MPEGRGSRPRQYAVESHTISWYPASRVVKTLWPHPEPGVNLTLEQSLAAVYANGESVTLWGPFVVSKELYERSFAIHRLLRSGLVQYRAISGPEDLSICDCIRAVAAVDPSFGREFYPLIRVGKPASRYVARQIMIRSPYEQYRYESSWLILFLGLNQYPIEVVPPQRIPREDCFLCQCPD